MLATGGSMVAAIDLLKKAGCKEIRALVLVAAPVGIDAVLANIRTCISTRRPSTTT